MSTTMRIGRPPGPTTIVPCLGCMNELPDIGAWPVIVIRYVPGTMWNANRPRRSACTPALSPDPFTSNRAPAIGRGAPGAGPPTVTITPLVSTSPPAVDDDPPPAQAERTTASSTVTSARYQIMPFGP
jgi:hypothetical protein